MITEERIKFETAQLAKEVGFNVPVDKFYNMDGTLDSCGHEDWNSHFNAYSCPTQDLLQKWLRNEFKMHVGIDYDTDGWAFFYLSNLKYEENVNWSKNYESYELALEAGLIKILEIIKE